MSGKKSGRHKGEKVEKPDNRGFLPCFSRHKDNRFPLVEFYANSVFITKLECFLSAVVTSPSTQILESKIHAKGGIQTIDPVGNKDDRELCQMLGWQSGKVYRVDYGDSAYKLLFGLDNEEQRCYVLALDTNHLTRPSKHY